MEAEGDSLMEEYVFTIEELFALARLLEHEFTSYDDEEIIKVLDKIFNAVNEYKRKNGMVG